MTTIFLDYRFVMSHLWLVAPTYSAVLWGLMWPSRWVVDWRGGLDYRQTGHRPAHTVCYSPTRPLLSMRCNYTALLIDALWPAHVYTHTRTSGQPPTPTPPGKQVCHGNIPSAAQHVGQGRESGCVVNNRIWNDLLSYWQSQLFACTI